MESKNNNLTKEIEDLKKKLKEEVNKSNDLIKKNQQIENDLKKEREVIQKNKMNQKLENNIKDEKKDIKENKNTNLIKTNQKLENEIKNKRQDIQENKNNFIENKDKIIDLYTRIDELKKKLSRYPIDLLEGEKLISVIFSSFDEKIHYSVICKNTEKFNRLEEKLYDDYPEYSETENYFTANGIIISKFKSLEQNKIKNSDVIILNQK